MKQNRIKDAMRQLYKSKNVCGLKKLKDDYPKFTLKVDCYIARLERKAMTNKNQTLEDFNLVEFVLLEMITSKDLNVSILKNGIEFVVLDSEGLYEAKGFEILEEAKEYVFNAYNLKASK